MESVSYPVVDRSGKKVGEISLDPKVFAVPAREAAVHAVVRWQRARKRSGTHSTLTRTMMLGGGKKPWKQKGTGRARVGSINSPLWVGGAVLFGPQPRDYDYRLPKRTRREALAAILSEKVREGTLFILKDLKVKEGKTKEMVEVLRGLKVQGEKISLVIGDGNQKLARASRNIAGVTTLPVKGANVYDLVCNRYLVCTEEAIVELGKRALTPARRSKKDSAD